jgi:hypothetical protein
MLHTYKKRIWTADWQSVREWSAPGGYTIETEQHVPVVGNGITCLSGDDNLVVLGHRSGWLSTWSAFDGAFMGSVQSESGLVRPRVSSSQLCPYVVRACRAVRVVRYNVVMCSCSAGGRRSIQWGTVHGQSS